MPSARLSNLQELFHLLLITILTNPILEKKTEAQTDKSLLKATQLVHSEAMIYIWAVRLPARSHVLSVIGHTKHRFNLYQSS